MSKNVLVISVDVRETRVALIEGGIIAELHIERRGSSSQPSSVGNVVLGKVTRVLPGLQAAFIDIGQERAAFLHVEDLIRPADFDTYLAGGRKHARDEEKESAVEVTGDEELDSEAEAELDPNAPIPAAVISEVALAAPSDEGSMPALDEPSAPVVSESDIDDDEEEPIEAADADGGDAGDAADGAEAANAEASDVEDMDAVDDDEDDEDAGDRDSDAGDRDSTEPVPAQTAAVTATDDTPPARGRTDDLEMDGLPGFTVSDPGEPVPRAAPREQSRDAGGRGRGRGRGREGTGGTSTSTGGGTGGGGGGGGGGNRNDGGRSRGRDGGRSDGRDKNRQNAPSRISKSTPIREVVKEGQEIIVQVTKDPLGTKGARCSSHISLPGRYVVYLPTVDHIGISKRIGSEKERARLRESIEGMKPPSGGLIVRTVAEGLTKKQLKADVGYLVRLWGEIAKKREGARSPTMLMSELDLVVKTARDLFTDEVDTIIIDDKTQYERLIRFVEMFAPERVKDVELYQEEEPIFDAYGIEDEIARALSRKVPLPSGGYLIIDQAEALTAIDVNTGRFVGKGSKDMEETILKTNIEAVNEIAYQLRFRNIGGLIILDLIDMERSSNREKVRRTLEDLLHKDKAKTTLNRISDLGLIEMTRKRTRESLGRLLHEPCFYCDGTGQLQSKETIAYEIMREIRRRRRDLPGYTIVVNAHPAVADLLTGPEKDAVAVAENKFMRKITVQPRKEYHLEQFDLQGK
ncbi:hypothetical protein BH09MYX1_BH09MYX1_15340 [soil metagenome]